MTVERPQHTPAASGEQPAPRGPLGDEGSGESPSHDRDPADGHVSGDSPPLLITANRDLSERITGLAAAVGVDPEEHAETSRVRRQWPRAPLVLVGDDLVGELIAMTLPRRAGVVLVGLDLDDASVWQRGMALGAESVVFLPDGDRWLTERLAQAADGREAEAPVVAVTGGRGGAGASTLATALAVTAARSGVRTVLVDTDTVGGGLDLLAGAEDAHGLRWPDLSHASGRLSGRALREALPGVGPLAVLSWDRGGLVEVSIEAVRTVLAACRRGCGLVVIDLPRQLDMAAREVAALADVALLVVPAELRAVAAAARMTGVLEPLVGDTRVVVRLPAPGGLVPDEIASVLGLPLAGVLRHEPGLAREAEQGLPPGRRGRGPLSELATAVLRDVLNRPLAPSGPRHHRAGEGVSA